MRFDVIYRHPGQSDHLIVSGESFYSTTDDGGVAKGVYGALLDGPAVPAQCDDLLVIKVTLLSGSSFLEFLSSVSIP